jgi:rhamnosyltransferase
MLDDSLFIDGVDHEWCWRASFKLQLRFFIIESVILSHMLGEGDRHFLIRKVAIPTPFRTYFQFRNYFKLVKRNYVPIYWKFSNGFKYIIKYFYFSLMVKPRMEYFKMINKGIIDGLRNNK